MLGIDIPRSIKESTQHHQQSTATRATASASTASTASASTASTASASTATVTAAATATKTTTTAATATSTTSITTSTTTSTSTSTSTTTSSTTTTTSTSTSTSTTTSSTTTTTRTRPQGCQVYVCSWCSATVLEACGQNRPGSPSNCADAGTLWQRHRPSLFPPLSPRTHAQHTTTPPHPSPALSLLPCLDVMGLICCGVCVFAIGRSSFSHIVHTPTHAHTHPATPHTHTLDGQGVSRC